MLCCKHGFVICSFGNALSTTCSNHTTALIAFITTLWMTRTYQEDTPEDITSLMLLLVICHLYCKLFNRVTQWVPLLKQELLTLSESSEFTNGFSGVRDTQSLVFCVVLCRLFICCPFSLSHCIFCPSIYYFWLLRWYPQTFLSCCRYCHISAARPKNEPYWLVR